LGQTDAAIAVAIGRTEVELKLGRVVRIVFAGPQPEEAERSEAASDKTVSNHAGACHRRRAYLE